jgi:hypothetical protein
MPIPMIIVANFAKDSFHLTVPFWSATSVQPGVQTGRSLIPAQKHRYQPYPVGDD